MVEIKIDELRSDQYTKIVEYIERNKSLQIGSIMLVHGNPPVYKVVAIETTEKRRGQRKALSGLVDLLSKLKIIN